MERFSQDQKILSLAIKGLIHCYYLEELSKPNDSWDWEKVGQKLKAFLMPLAQNWLENRIANIPEGLKESYKDKFNFFNLEKKTVYFKDSHFPIGAEDIETLVRIMDKLKESLSKKIYHHFKITNIENIALTSIDYRSSTAKKPADRSISMRDITKSAMLAIHEQTSINTSVNNISLSSAGYMIFSVEPISEFGKLLLFYEPMEETFNQIPSINFLSWTSLTSLIRSVLVSFHLSFGNYERLKLCRNCQKMFFEKRKGAREFCSNNCRVNFNYAVEPQSKRLCRQRQKKYLEYYNRYDFPIYKDDCKICTVPAKSGKCPVFLRKSGSMSEDIDQ